MVKKGNKKASKKKNLKNSNDDKIKKLEDVRRIAAVNAKLWETRVEIAEKVKDKIQERAKQLADDNARLSDALRQSERESIDVFSYLKKQNEDKDSEIRDAKQQISCTNSEKEKKCDKIKELEREIMQLDEYKSERIRTDNEIKQLRDEVQNQKCLIENMETKFFEEKLKMRESSIKDIKALAEEAHKISIRNLDDSVKLSFVQNVAMRRFITFLRRQLVSAEDLSRSLNEENKKLTLEKETLEGLLLSKSLECKKLKELIQEKDQKLELYQCEIEHLTEDLNKQKTIFNEQVTLQTVESSKTIENLTRTLEFERKQMIRISSLANRILQQRNEIEEFFITSLNYVRDEIKVNQNNYIHDAKSAYEASIRLAYLGKSNYPPIRTFQNKINSTNNIYDDFKIAQKIPKSTHLTIRDLTWEQKERVLSILFEKMNQSKMKLNNKINSEKSSGKNIFLNNEYGINQLNEMDPKSILYTSMNDHESNRGGQDKGEMDDNNNNNTNNSNNNNSNGNNNDNSNEEDSNKIVMNKSEELTKKLYEKLIKFSNHKKDQNNLTDQFDNDHEPNQRNIDSIMDDQINQTKVPYPSPQ
ncbi:putative ubiquitin-protein ligase BRE1 [Schistosoma mansoni]|uniref:putative ubiquitin-protein ligase BRE1 n=1 Tax=Schistosoma mansoni TaxID=6183 RepID=UPI00022DC1A3|nr:putative ubiquitin-protein ligase BRE1 [Schistosoma mansoni]|eukprot:XP_018652422.1 putative ubiquitin-protein ligase BRE1 [Schistosoma mansoni]